MLQQYKDKLNTIVDDKLLLASLEAVFDENIDYAKATKRNVGMSNENLGAFMRAYNERLALKEEFFRTIESTRRNKEEIPKINQAR